MYQWKLSAVCVHHTKWKSLHINHIWYLSNNEALLQVSTDRCVESSMAKVLSVSQVTNVLLVCQPGLGWTKKSLKINKQHADLTCNIEKIMHCMIGWLRLQPIWHIQVECMICHAFNYNKEESALFLPVADRDWAPFHLLRIFPCALCLRPQGAFRASREQSWLAQPHITRWHHEVVPSIPHQAAL